MKPDSFYLRVPCAEGENLHRSQTEFIELAITNRAEPAKPTGKKSNRPAKAKMRVRNR